MNLMRINFYLFIFVLSAGMSSTIHSNEAQPNIENLNNVKGVWHLNKIETGKLDINTQDSKAKFTFEFIDGDTLKGVSACNRFKGRYEINNSRLSINSNGKTKRRCFYENQELASLESRFPSAIQAAEIIIIEEQSLAIAISEHESWYFIKAQ